MTRNIVLLLAALLLPITVSADILGFVEQKFSDIHFDKGQWARVEHSPCYTYTAQQDGATVDVFRIGISNFVPFKAKKGLRVIVCGSVAAFDEGFETEFPISAGASRRPSR